MLHSWKKLESHDITVECAKLSLDLIEGRSEEDLKCPVRPASFSSSDHQQLKHDSWIGKKQGSTGGCRDGGRTRPQPLITNVDKTPADKTSIGYYRCGQNQWAKPQPVITNVETTPVDKIQTAYCKCGQPQSVYVALSVCCVL